MADELREKVRAALPPNVLALLEEIETFAGRHVDFEPYTFPLRSNSFNPRSPATAVGPEGATIYLHDFDSPDLHGVTHELLHIRRYWIEGVPQIQPARNVEANLGGVQNIENGLEHLVIVPREKEFGFDSDYWNGVARHRWEQFPWPDVSARRNDILLERLALELVTDPAVQLAARDKIQEEGLTTEAELFATRILELLQNKERAVACIVRFMTIPKGLLHLAYLDIRNRSVRIGQIPDH